MIEVSDALNSKTALFFIDESKNISSTDSNGKPIKCTLIGLLCVQGDQFLQLEENFLRSRVSQRLWREVHFENASGSYVKKYSNILEKYITNPYVTFHSRMFANVEKENRKNIHDGLTKYDDIFREEAYRLIRSVIMKCLAHGMNAFYILADEYTKGRDDYRKIMERLNNDDKIPEVKNENNLCCTVGDSRCCGALQISDLLVSTLGQYKLKTGGLSKERSMLLDVIFRVNGNIDPMKQKRAFPTLYSSKFHYYAVASYRNIGNNQFELITS